MMYQLLHFFLKLLSSIPFRVLYALSDGLYYLLYYGVGYRRKVVRRNLTECFPEKELPEIKRIEKQFYRFFVDMVFESAKMTTISAEEISRRMKFINAEGVNARLREGHSQTIYLGHYGNWEWVASMPLCLEKSMTGAQIYHKLRNEHMDRLLLRNRERMGSRCVEMRKTARYINDLVSRQVLSVTGYIADQSPKKSEVRHFLPFLNHWTPVLTGTEKLTKHYGFDAWYLDVRRVKRGYYEAEFVRMHDQPQSLPDFELTALYFQHLEQTIRRQPELYLWTHNRFKHAEKLNV